MAPTYPGRPLDPRTIPALGTASCWVDQDKIYITKDGTALFAITPAQLTDYTVTAGVGWRLATTDEISWWVVADTYRGHQGVPRAPPLPYPVWRDQGT